MVVKGLISWRYWIRAPAGEEDLSHARVVGEDIGRMFIHAPSSYRNTKLFVLLSELYEDSTVMSTAHLATGPRMVRLQSYGRV